MKNENLFVRFYDNCFGDLSPNDSGRKQFFDMQSKGIKPDNPDIYYKQLMKGKENFDFLVREYEQLHKTGEWWGLFQLWKDWQGERYLLKHLLKWHEDLPNWITDEDITEEEIYILTKKELKI